MAIYLVVVRDPIVISVFDIMLALIILFDQKSLYFKSSIPTDKSLLLYLGSIIIFLIYHRHFATSLKEIIQIIEIYFFYVIIVSYLSDFSDFNSQKFYKFFKAFFYLIFLGLFISIIIGTLTRERGLYNFLAVPLLIISLLSIFHDKKFEITLLKNIFSSLLITFFSMAVLFYENSRTGLVFFVLFIGLIVLNLKKRYMVPIIATAVITITIFTNLVNIFETEDYRSVAYDPDLGAISYVRNADVAVTRGLGSIYLLLNNLPVLIDYITDSEEAIMSEVIEGSNYERLDQLKFVYQSFLANPILGLGPNQAAEIANVHGVFFVVLVDYGLIGLLILLSYVFNAFMKARAIKKNNNLFDDFLYYYLFFSIFVLLFVSAGLFPILPFIFVSTVIHIRHHSLLHEQ